jgi:hypothetical protein
MTNTDKRLDRLYPALSARERGILTLVDCKEGRKQDHQLRYTAPESQAFEFNHLIGLMHAAGGDLAHLILIHREKIAQTDLRLAWLTSLCIYGLECSRVRSHLLFDVREPITQSVYDQRVQEIRAELVPVRECAQILAERHDWNHGDLVEHDGERHPTQKAWKRVMREKAAQLRSVVEDGTLVGRGKGNRLKITCGSFYDWLGDPVPVLPDWGIDVEVFADDQVDEAQGLTKRRTDVLDLMDRLAVRSELPFDLERPLPEPPAEGVFDDELLRGLAVSIRAEVKCHWLQRLTFELVIDEMTEEFAGEDILQPDVREVFDEAKAKLIELHERAQHYTGPFDLPAEPDDETLASIRRIVARQVRG